MNKLKLKQTGKEVKMGDMLVKVEKLFGISIPVEWYEITENSLPDLIEQGIIVTEDSGSNIDITMESAVQHLANRIGWGKENVEKYFRNLYKISPTAVFEILLKEVAILLDEKYPDYISNSKEIWVINKINGEVQKLKDSSKIKSFKHFAAFRNLEDALIAKKVMAPALEDLYGE